MQSKVEELEKLIDCWGQHDQIKDDAIAHLSDQLMTCICKMGGSNKHL
jgi:hypothetical protein